MRSVKDRRNNDVASTPIAPRGSPPRFGDDSPIVGSPSPVPFFYAQDCSQGENVVVWDYYSPKSSRPLAKFPRDALPRRRRNVLTAVDFSPPIRPPQRRAKPLRQIDLKDDFLRSLREELSALNERVQHSVRPPPERDTADSDMFEDTLTDYSHLINKQNQKTSSQTTPVTRRISRESENMESDDSINEYLIRASQLVEEQKDTKKSKRKVEKTIEKELKTVEKSVDTSSNDSFDNLISNMNDSYIDVISQMPRRARTDVASSKEGDSSKARSCGNKTVKIADTSWENISNFSSLLTDTIIGESKNKFVRHKSMPVSNSDTEKKANSSFSRHNSVPISENTGCTRDEIKKKKEAAREKLLSKKQPISNQIGANVPLVTHRLPATENDTKKSTNVNGIKVTFDSQDVPLKHSPARSNIENINYNNKVKPYRSEKRDNSFLRKMSVHNEIERKRLDALQRLQKKRNQLSLKT